MKVLAITVGGSCAPVVTAIGAHAPHFVLFIVSTGKKGSRSMVDGTDKPVLAENKTHPLSIVEQSRLTPDRYDFIELDEPDRLDHCYDRIYKGLSDKSEPSSEKIADYTGGTKTMSAALVLVALQLGWGLSVVTGNRTDLQTVRDGTEYASVVNSHEVRARQLLTQAENLFNQFAYASAAELAASLPGAAPLSSEVQRQVQHLVTLARGFDGWDRFDHQGAYNLLEPYQAEMVPQWIFLKQLVGPSRATGYQAVLDLLNNAKRRAKRHRYDDAVARLYRALEMFAQVCLQERQPSLDASDLDLELLPPEIRSKYARQDEKVKLSLVQDYELLADLHDPIGEIYQKQRGKVKDMLNKRNQSILAHGNTPIDEKTYEDMREKVEAFLRQGFEALGIKFEYPQFPRIQDGKLNQR